MRRCVSWWHTISNQLKSLVTALNTLLPGGDCHGDQRRFIGSAALLR
ncbi:hypothetical protein SynA1524_02643 [Synechococcus sp. A15-24]|nr:hypothetical protein SynA1524_02643 [Synechococcus sp. A15-24]